MARFNKDRASGGRSGRGGGGRSERPTMYDAICDECGKRCSVPFKPSNDKPVYCSDCFEDRGNMSDGRGRSNDRRGGGRDYDDKEMYSAICDDCGRNCEVPFKPSGDKPIYCSQCFEDRGNSHDNDSGRGRGRDSRREAFGGGGSREKSVDMSEVTKKLDKIIELLEAAAKKPTRVYRKKEVERPVPVVVE